MRQYVPTWGISSTRLRVKYEGQDQVTRKNHYGQSVITESPTSIRINKDATKQYEKQQKEREYNWSEY